MKRGVVGAVLVLGLGYLLAWPVPVDPVAFHPPPAPPLQPTGKLEIVQRLALPAGSVGPEGTAVTPDGAVYGGAEDGRILRWDKASATPVEVANTGGRPMGMQVDHTGALIICDAMKGLLRFHDGKLTTLATTHGGVPFGFTDDVDEGADGTLYFSDATTRFDVFHYRMDALEHGTTGRLLAYDPATQQTRQLAAGISFANGVALGAHGAFVAFTETWNYRIQRYWLTGERAGTVDTLLDNTPGFPDNITYNAQRGVFWVALFSPRNGALDAVGPYPLLRSITARLPQWMQPHPANQAMAMAVDAKGNVVHLLVSDGPEAFFPITSVVEQDGLLYLGSLSQPAVAVAKAPPMPEKH